MPDAVTQRNAPVAATVGLTVLGLLLVAVAVVYLTQSAAHLPSLFPGHQAGQVKHHTKHGLAALTLALLSWVGAWFTTGTRGEAGEPLP